MTSIKGLTKRLRAVKRGQDQNFSYSQSGEDRIISFIFDWIKVSRPTYLDIGAHHPKELSNTYLFYKRGCRGVCVEPDPTLFRAFLRHRKGDVCLNVGVGSGDRRMADFYEMSASGLNTFCKEDAQRYEALGQSKIKAVVQLPIVHINSILADHFPDSPDLVSIDTEGMDLEILEGYDFSRHRAKVFCIETLEYLDDGSLSKRTDILDLMRDRGYGAYADTYMNTIFLDDTIRPR